jgi:hypothetical protein
VLLAVPAHAQEPKGPVELRVAPATGVLTVQLHDLLEEPGLRRALHSGLPLRIRVVAELWKDRFFDSQRGRAEWRATVLHDPLERTYQVETSEAADANRGEMATFSSVGEAQDELERAFSLPLRPVEEGRFYYMAVLEVETLSLSDLEELRRWLRGDLAAAVAGEQKVEGAVGRGVGRLMVRVLGLPVRRIRVRTERFEFSPGGTPS